MYFLFFPRNKHQDAPKPQKDLFKELGVKFISFAKSLFSESFNASNSFVPGGNTTLRLANYKHFYLDATCLLTSGSSCLLLNFVA